MIRVLDQSTTDYTAGVVILPKTCTVVEEGNGLYTLDMDVPYDENCFRHRLLTPGSIIVAPAPPHNAPFAHAVTTQGLVKKYKAVGSAYQAKEVVAKYRDTDTVGAGEWIYVYKTVTRYSEVPVYKSSALSDKIASVAHGAILTLIELASSYIFCATKDGIVGYVKLSQCAYFEESTGDVVKLVSEGSTARFEQPFRVVRAIKKTPGMISVYAEHKYFDAMATALAKIEATNMALADLCALLSVGPIRYIAGMQGYVTGTYDKQNPVSVAADACKQLNAQIIRDGDNAYFLPADTSNVSAELRTGQTIVSLTEQTDHGALVTRFIPNISNAEGTAIDSEHIGDYPLTYEERIDAESQEAAQAEADARFADGCDLPQITIDVVCKTGALDALAVFDKTHIVDARLEIDVTGQINRTEFDAITGHMIGISVGSAQKRMTAAVYSGTNGGWQKTDGG